MGRQLRRVALDFSWPLNEVYEGFINPYYTADECSACGGSGHSELARRLKEQWYGGEVIFYPYTTGSERFSPAHPTIAGLAAANFARDPGFMKRFAGTVEAEALRLASHFNVCWSHHLSQEDVDALVEAGRLWEFTRLPRTPEQLATWEEQRANGGGYWMKESNGYCPTAKEVNEWSLSGMGHDSLNAWVCIEARCKRAGESAICDVCCGSGEIWEDEEAKAQCEAWKPVEPPAGDGWQLWETVSEGSPISPVFGTPEDLAAWLTLNDDDGLLFSEWMTFLEHGGWAPSAIMVGGQVLTGTAGIVHELEKTWSGS